MAKSCSAHPARYVTGCEPCKVEGREHKRRARATSGKRVLQLVVRTPEQQARIDAIIATLDPDSDEAKRWVNERLASSDWSDVL